MARSDPPFEIHLHGEVQLRAQVQFEQIQEALKPIWKYAGARSLADGARSSYEDEPGIRFDAPKHMLQFCWTVGGDDDFRQTLDEMCMNLNELADTGAAIEVSFYDTEFDDEDGEEDPDSESRDDFMMLFVGPNPAAIMQVQRDLLVQDLVALMERHFDGSELSGVVAEVDKLFTQRFDALVSSLEIGKPRRPVFEDFGMRQDQPCRPAIAEPHMQRAGLDRIAQDTMIVAPGRIAVPGLRHRAAGSGDKAVGQSVSRRRAAFHDDLRRIVRRIDLLRLPGTGRRECQHRKRRAHRCGGEKSAQGLQAFLSRCGRKISARYRSW